MTNKEILFASLVGSKVAKMIPRFSALQNEMGKHVLPTIPFLPLQNEQGTKVVNFEAFGNLWKADKPTPVNEQFFPLGLSKDGKDFWYLPFEPLITISGGFDIKKTNVSKVVLANETNEQEKNFIGGTIKERYSQKDYDITITGFLMGENERGTIDECFPYKDFQKLDDFLLYKTGLYVRCPFLELLNVHKITVESWVYPFTKGENVQAYEIKAVSDSPYYLQLNADEV